MARSPGRTQSGRGAGGSPSSAADLLCALPLFEFYLSNESGPLHPRHSGVLLWLVKDRGGALLPSRGRLPTRRIVLELLVARKAHPSFRTDKVKAKARSQKQTPCHIPNRRHLSFWNFPSTSDSAQSLKFHLNLERGEEKPRAKAPLPALGS